jgi:hypothetical protein
MLSAFPGKDRPAFWAGDLDFPSTSGNADCYAATGAAEIAVRFAVPDAVFCSAEPAGYPVLYFQIPVVFLPPFIDVSGKHAKDAKNDACKAHVIQQYRYSPVYKNTDKEQNIAEYQ